MERAITTMARPAPPSDTRRPRPWTDRGCGCCPHGPPLPDRLRDRKAVVVLVGPGRNILEFTVLVDGIRPLLSLQLVLAQRLVRVICENCAEAHTPAPHEHEWLRYELGDTVDQRRYVKGRGCAHCGGTGYSGRTGVYEMLEMTNEIVEALNAFIHAHRHEYEGNLQPS